LGAEEKATLRGLILAFQSDPGLQKKIGESLASAPPGHRLFLLETLSESTLPQIPASWKGAIGAALSHDDPALRLQAVRCAAMLRLLDYDDRLAELAVRAGEALPLRLEALRAIVGRRPQLAAPAFELLLAQVSVGGEALTRLAAAEILRRAALGDE